MSLRSRTNAAGGKPTFYITHRDCRWGVHQMVDFNYFCYRPKSKGSNKVNSKKSKGDKKLVALSKKVLEHLHESGETTGTEVSAHSCSISSVFLIRDTYLFKRELSD